MIFENLNLVKCPLCKNSIKWDYNGEFTEGSVKRLTNGEIVCDENHTWTICEEILRIDNQKSNENQKINLLNMVFLIATVVYQKIFIKV